MQTEGKISDRVRAWLEESLAASGKNQSDLARALGIAPSAVTRILQGTRQLSIGELAEAIRFFETREARIHSMAAAMIGHNNLLEAIPLEKTNIYQILFRESYYDALSRVGDKNFSIYRKADYRTQESVEVSSYNDNSQRIWILPSYDVFGTFDDNPMIRWIKVSDDALKGFVEKGDICFVNVNSNKITSSGIYALENGLGLPVLRRIEISSRFEKNLGEVRIFADNPQYESFNQKVDDLKVIGSLVGIFRGRGF